MARMVSALIDLACSWQITDNIGNNTTGILTIVMIGGIGESDSPFSGY